MKLTLAFNLIFLLATSSAHAQSASDCQHRILLIPQTHATVLSGALQVLPENVDRTTRSQFAIAKYLEENKSNTVFSEQISSDTTVGSVSPEFRKVAAQIKMMFPKGLPKNFSELSAQQKDVIAKAGGDAISFILRNTEMLHRVVENDQIENELIGKVSAWAQKNPYAIVPPTEITDIIFNKRENLALDQINKFFEANSKQRDVILVYGSDHYDSFRSHPDKFPAQCILVPHEFQSAITSPYDQNNSSTEQGYGTNQQTATRSARTSR